MEHLSKQQLILLALLVSFVTSLSTGIFTVSLMSQAPQGVMQTINQVVEKTIEKAVVPGGTAAVTDAPARAERTVSNAINTVSKSVVKITDADNGNVLGLGLVMTMKGIVMADKATVAQALRYNAVFSDGTSVAMQITLSQISGDIVFLAPIGVVKLPNITPINFAPSVSLGQNVYYLSGTTTFMLRQGLVTEAGGAISTPLNENSSPIQTSIFADKEFWGSPLFNMNGEVIGMNTSSMEHTTTNTNFYPIINVKTAVSGL